ncbi:MAG: ORF6N domain-containing protein [Bacteroidales bacterium]
MSKSIIKQQTAPEDRIFSIRGVQVMLDFHLSDLFGVETKRLNEQVKRNIKRFPENFMFQLSPDEWENLKSQNATAKPNETLWSQNATAKRRTIPYVFTEQGVAMLSAILNSEVAISVSIQIINAFIKMRQLVLNNSLIEHRFNKIETKQHETDRKFEQVFKALEGKKTIPNEGIFFDGQIFDAYAFVSDLIKSAKQRIVLIDNYVDETVLTLLSKRKKSVSAIIYSSQITKQLKLDLQKHNQQYAPIELLEFSKSHDRFLITDEVVYHFGASLKDLGKKWFAFSKMEMTSGEILCRLRI